MYLRSLILSDCDVPKLQFLFAAGQAASSSYTMDTLWGYSKSGPSKDKYGSLVKVASAKIVKNEKTGEIVSFDLSIVE